MNSCRAALVLLGVLVVVASLVSHTPPALGARQQAFVEAELVVRLSMELPVSREQLYDAWTLADELVQWFPGFAEMTVAEGGEYRFAWDGWDDEWTGTYLEIDRPEKLVFTWSPPAAVFPGGAYETTVTLTFEEVDEEHSRMLLEHSGFRGGAEMESHLEAWKGYFYNLRAFLLLR